MKLTAPQVGLRFVELFSDLAPGERSELATALDTIALKRANEMLLRQGEPADALYIGRRASGGRSAGGGSRRPATVARHQSYGAGRRKPGGHRRIWQR
jgi:hypothetical protein